jgi:hypothetical protein
MDAVWAELDGLMRGATLPSPGDAPPPRTHDCCDSEAAGSGEAAMVTRYETVILRDVAPAAGAGNAASGTSL